MEPAIIPYVDQHTGPKRVLDLNLMKGMVSGPRLEVSIDGRSYPVGWGRCLFEIPADRPVSIGVAQTINGGSGHAQVVLTPQLPAQLEYRGPANLARPGALGAPGTTKRNGLGCQVMLLLVLVLILLGGLALVASFFLLV